MSNKKGVEALLPVTLGGRIPFARGMRAGNWIFATGILATDFVSGLAPEVASASRPLSGRPKWDREAMCMYKRALEVLEAAGAGFSQVVRMDQYYPDWRAVPFLHQARREYCGNYIAPSTSILLPGLLVPDAGMSMDLIGISADSGWKINAVNPQGLDLPSTSSFVPVVTVDDYVFVAGFLAAWQPGDLGGIAPEAKVPEGHLWKGNRIQLEVDYIVRNKLIPALKAAGSSLDNVVKAQVYLADIVDVPAFNLVWARHFGTRIPATTFIPTMKPGFAIADARCEINLVALKDSATNAITAITTPDATPACDGHPFAVRAGDLLLFSGLLAADSRGLIKDAQVDPRQPYFRSSVEAQMEYMLDRAQEICEKAGTSLSNVVRIQQYHTDLNDFYPACSVWQKRLPNQPLPISAMRVPDPLLVPGCTVQLDLWVFVP